MKTQYFILLLSFCMTLLYGQGQESHTAIPDSLIQKSYRELGATFNKVKYDFVKADSYAKAYLKKGIMDKNIIRQANAYYFLSFIHEPVLAEKYAGSIISLTLKINNHIYPVTGFIAKAVALQKMGKYREALHQLLKKDIGYGHLR